MCKNTDIIFGLRGFQMTNYGNNNRPLLTVGISYNKVRSLGSIIPCGSTHYSVVVVHGNDRKSTIMSTEVNRLVSIIAKIHEQVERSRI